MELIRNSNDLAISSTSLREACAALETLGVFTSSIEKRLIDLFTQYYSSKNIIGTANDQAIEKLQQIEKFRKSEIRLFEEIFPTIHISKFISLLDTKFTLGFVTQILKNFPDFMTIESSESLKKLYLLSTTVGLTEAFSRLFKEFTEKTVSKIIQKDGSDISSEIVDGLCSFKDITDYLITTCLIPSFFSFQRDAFEAALNKDTYLISKCICTSLNTLLSDGSSMLDSREVVTEKIQKILGLFRFLHVKDIFEALYSKDLSNRLLFHKNKSMDLERAVLHHLKDQCGANFTTKLEAMFHDLEVSSDILSNFLSTSDLKGPVALSFQVLNKHFWPIHIKQLLPAMIPAALPTLCHSFEKYFQKTFPKKKLEWAPSSSTCVIVANLPNVRNHDRL